MTADKPIVTEVFIVESSNGELIEVATMASTFNEVRQIWSRVYSSGSEKKARKRLAKLRRSCYLGTYHRLVQETTTVTRKELK